MKKVGILSMQRIKNYGSFLQAYALKDMIEELGHKVEFVDYHIQKPIIEKESKTSIFTKVFKELKGNAKFFHKLQYFKHKYQFGKKYFDLLGLTEEFNYNPKLDTLVIGSDEVFNCIQSNNNVGYSLELFGKNNNADKVITYAASFGNTTLDKLNSYNKTEEIAALLNRMDAISVRDNNSYLIVNELTDKEIVSNLDPVLVYDYVNRDGLIPNIKVKEKYIIVYAYSGRISDYESKVIKKYAKEKGLKVYSIGGVQKCADKFIDCSPFEVLAYFKNAECIITDTFHGSIFSIINNKLFLTLVRKSVGNSYGNEEKLTSLLKKLELTKRIIYNIDDINRIENEIDYNCVGSILKIERENTINYLKERL